MPQTNAPLTAADIMTPSPRTCSPFSTVLEAVMIFREADCGVVPVVEDGCPVGIVTDRDVALALADHENDLGGIPVSAIMTPDVVSVAPETPIAQLNESFGARGVRRLLVSDAGGRLLGIVTWADVAPYTTDAALGRAVGTVVEPR